MSWNPKLVVLIAVGVLGWGLFHAVGAYRYNHDFRRALMVLGCTIAFLGFWLAMLSSRRRRLEREAPQDAEEE